MPLVNDDIYPRSMFKVRSKTNAAISYKYMAERCMHSSDGIV